MGSVVLLLVFFCDYVLLFNTLSPASRNSLDTSVFGDGVCIKDSLAGGGSSR